MIDIWQHQRTRNTNKSCNSIVYWEFICIKFFPNLEHHTKILATLLIIFFYANISFSSNFSLSVRFNSSLHSKYSTKWWKIRISSLFNVFFCCFRIFHLLTTKKRYIRKNCMNTSAEKYVSTEIVLKIALQFFFRFLFAISKRFSIIIFHHIAKKYKKLQNIKCDRKRNMKNMYAIQHHNRHCSQTSQIMCYTHLQTHRWASRKCWCYILYLLVLLLLPFFILFLSFSRFCCIDILSYAKTMHGYEFSIARLSIDLCAHVWRGKCENSIFYLHLKYSLLEFSPGPDIHAESSS